MNCSPKGSISQVGAVKQSTEVEPEGGGWNGAGGWNRLSFALQLPCRDHRYILVFRLVVSVVTARELESKGEPVDHENESGGSMKTLAVLVEEEGLGLWWTFKKPDSHSSWAGPADEKGPGNWNQRVYMYFCT